MGKSVSKLNQSKASGLRIALYIRLSKEDYNPEGSLKNQEERLRATVQLKNMQGNFGEITAVYIETKTAKNTNRKELQRLLMSIRKREVDLVMVSELSRISRSVKDFTEIWELMQRNNCGFCSLRENFDTTTAAGEMVLLIVASLAQFERRQISERVIANNAVRSKRGLFNGGGIPFGYKRIPERKGFLEVDEAAAIVVRQAFKTYINEASLLPAARWLNRHGYKMKENREGGGSGGERIGAFTVDNLQAMIRNKKYIGVKVYKQGAEVLETEAVWKPIVSREVFEIANNMLSKNKKTTYTNSSGKDIRHPYLLSSLVSCKKCGDSLPGKSAYNRVGKRFSYYEHSWAVKKAGSMSGLKHTCWPFRVPTREIEEVVWNEVTRVLTEPETALEIMRQAQKVHKANPGLREVERLKHMIHSINGKLESLAGHLMNIPKSVSPAPIYSQMEKLGSQKESAERELAKCDSGEVAYGLPAKMADYDTFRSTLLRFLKTGASPDARAVVVRYLIRSIAVHEEGIDISWAVGEDFIKGTLIAWSNETDAGGMGQEKNKAKGDASGPDKTFSSSACSQTLTSGWVTLQQPKSLVSLKNSTLGYRKSPI